MEDGLEDWGTPALSARRPPRFCATLFVFTMSGSSLGFPLLDLPLPPRPAVDFILDIGFGGTGLEEDGGERGSSLIGAHSNAASSSTKTLTYGSDINLHKR